MARIGYEEGDFVGLGTYEERGLWKQYGFVWKPLKKRWVAPTLKIAQSVPNLYWMEAAVEAAAGMMHNAEVSYDMSFKGSTDFQVPLSDAVRDRGWDFMPFQKAGIEYASMRHDTLIGDQPGLGKQADVETPILTPVGWVRMGDLKVGDLVYSVDGWPTRVTGVFPQGIKPNYRITFRDGTTTNSGPEHLWTVASPLRRNRAKASNGRVKEYTTKTLQELMDAGLTSSPDGGRVGAKWYIPLVEPVQFPTARLPIDPYILGVLIGDGAISNGAVLFSNPAQDSDIRAEVEHRLPAGYRMQVEDYTSCPRIRIISETRNHNQMHRDIVAMSLNVLSAEKFIPTAYMLGSVEQRLDLLRGLMDTDGSSGKNRITFHTISARLARDVAELVRSLGGVAIERWYDRSHEDKPAECQVNVKLAVNPFLTERKRANWRPQKIRRYIHAAEYVGEREQVCIAVEHPSRLYVTENYIVTHNTIQAIGCQNVDPELRRTLVVVPASLKENWRREWVLWGCHDYSVGIAETQRKTKVRDGFYKNGKPKWKVHVEPTFFPMTDVVIINYDILDRFPEIWEMQWDYLVCDECHALKTEDSKRTLMVMGGYKRAKKGDGTGGKGTWFKAVEATVRVFLSGTPMLNRPIEMWPICKAFDAGDLGRNREQYAYRYCAAHTTSHGLDVSGASNLDELQELLRKKFMVRRMKKQVLPELPDKTRVVLTLDSPEIRELVAREDELAEALGLFEKMVAGTREENEAVEGAMIAERAVKMGLDKAYAEAEGENAVSVSMLDMDYATAVSGLEPPAVAIAFEEIALIRKELGIAKLGVVIPWVKTFLDGGEKLVLFGYHTDVVEGLIEALKPYQPAYIYGKVPLKLRQGMVDRFQNDEGCRVIIGNIHAMGVGHTLVRAWNVAFAEGDWTPALMEQCEDRVCRIGQTSDKIFSYHLVANGSLDARIAQSSKEKSDNIEKAIG